MSTAKKTKAKVKEVKEIEVTLEDNIRNIQKAKEILALIGLHNLNGKGT